ncbi:hypothetical protein [Crocosphaera sp.]|uniref:hypothetical protein n=1 Tax=Crocosphaera sp. TaxID=2729996 RepID=UPI002607D749|nr:hypothetical protein [Crocosphaera sp.]MDJ0583431.1 hypothetical protein [Crocosphaera sp.]
MTKKEAIELAVHYRWTAQDAKRAYDGLNCKEASQEELLLALIKFAGPELYQRQKLQAAQKALVTKKKKKIEAIEIKFAEEIREGEEKLQEMRSTFLAVIFRLYAFAKTFGMEDPWIEALIEAHKAYFDHQNEPAA